MGFVGSWDYVYMWLHIVHMVCKGHAFLMYMQLHVSCPGVVYGKSQVTTM